MSVDLQLISLTFYGRKNQPLLYRNIQHFRHIRKIFSAICVAHFPPGPPDKELTMKLMERLSTYKLNSYMTNTSFDYHTIKIRLDWDIKSINLFLNYIQKDLDSEKLLNMKKSHFEIVMRIFSDIEIDNIHPLYNAR